MATDENKTYSTPNGVFQGTPPIDYPKTPGFTPAEYVPVGGVLFSLMATSPTMLIGAQ